MNILILGASSFVGTALAQAYSPRNDLILVGRNFAKLVTAKNACSDAGVASIILIEEDYSLGTDLTLKAIEEKRIDLIIDAASASSSKKDSEIERTQMSDLVSADFLSRMRILDYILRTQNTIPAVIFISTVLTLVKSPGRTVYTALKGLYEIYLHRLKCDRSDFRLLIVHVGTVIDTKIASDKPAQLASAVIKAFDNRKERLLFGLSGRLILALFYVQPGIFYLVTLMQRKIRQLFG
ncbi:MAG: SDR family NAD(P)-dependent oxidoreductase [Proteobacteria bacterium]|nr:SDR family NAD(P)-dependent oxidoreductase [Pseudomonadota bacterium]